MMGFPWPRAVVLIHDDARELPAPKAAAAVGLQWGSRICTSDKSPGDADATVVGTTREHQTLVWHETVESLSVHKMNLNSEMIVR